MREDSMGPTDPVNPKEPIRVMRGPTELNVGRINLTPDNLYAQRATMIEYLQLKTSQGDWHGVSDAANDLRVLEAQIDLYQKGYPK